MPRSVQEALEKGHWLQVLRAVPLELQLPKRLPLIAALACRQRHEDKHIKD